MALFLLGTFYAAMAAAGYVVELVFGGFVFLILAAALIIRFVRTGGVAMLRMMGGSPDSQDHMDAHVSHTH